MPEDTVTAQTTSPVPQSTPAAVTSSPKKGGSKLPLLAILALVVVVIVGVGAYFALSLTGGKTVAQTTATQGKLCTGMKIVYFAGGNAGEPVPSVITNGVKQAQSDLGPNIEYVYSGWLTDKMALQFKDAIAEKPDAIAMMGHPGSDIMGPLIDEAERKGIIVTLQNVDLQDIRTKYIANGFGYAGADLYKFGLGLSQGLVRKFGLKSGDEGVVLLAAALGPNGVSTGRALMGQGDYDGLKQAGLTVHTELIPDAVNNTPDSPAGDAFIKSILAKYPKVKVIIDDHGELTAAMGPILKRLGVKPGEYIVGGYDLSPKTVTDIQEGYVAMVKDQELYLEGYLPILQVCLAKKYQFSGLYIDTGVGLVDSTNVNQIVNLVKDQIR